MGSLGREGGNSGTGVDADALTESTTGTKDDACRQCGDYDLARPTGWGKVKRRGGAAHAIGAGISHRSVSVKDTKGKGAVPAVAASDGFRRLRLSLLSTQHNHPRNRRKGKTGGREFYNYHVQGIIYMYVCVCV